MPDREKVVKGLECCMKWTGEPNTATCHCSDCSYTNMDILGQRCLIDLINDALALLQSQPQIVRCKDCKHRPKKPNWETYESGFDIEFPEGSKCPCHSGDEWYSWYPEDDWFCADGEQKDGDGE